MAGQKNNKIKFLFLSATLLMLVFFHFSHSLNSDEGIVLAAAWDMINGKVLYLDFFEFISPASFYLIYWIFLIFGPSYLIAKLTSIIFLFFASWGIYKIAELIEAHKFNFFLPLVFAALTIPWPIISYHIYSMVAVIWSLYFFISFINTKKQSQLIYSALLTSLAILIYQPRGVVLLLSLLTATLFLNSIKPNKKIFLNFLIFFIFSTPPLLLLLLKWPFAILWQNLIIWPLFEYQEVAQVPLYLLFFFLFYYGFIFFLLKDKKNRKINTLLFVGVLLLLSTFALADSFHIHLIIFPLIILLPSIIDKINTLEKRKLIFYKVLFNLLGIIAFLPILIYLYYVPPFYSVAKHPVIEYVLSNCPDDQIYAGPFIPGLYFETRKLNPTSFSYLIQNHNTKEQFNIAVQELANSMPECVILNYSLVDKYQHKTDNPVDEFIENNYQQVFKESNFIIFKKN